MPSNDTAKQAGTTARPRELARDSITVSATNTSGGLLPTSPVELLQGLVKQTQLLACLQWLGEFQILAYIPLTQRVAYDDLAHLTDVPPAQIRRIVRTTATAGFLCEPQPDHVAHTPLSVQFVKRPSFLDALMFTAETVVPTALRMAEATRQQVRYQRTDVNPYQIATNSSSSLAVACEKDAKLQRKASAFQRLTATSRANAVTRLLSSMGWDGLGQTVVEVNAVSTATAKALCDRNSALCYVVQMREDVKLADSTFSARQTESRRNLKVQRRAPRTAQTETSAAVYLLHMPDPFFCASSGAHADLCTAELRAHLDLLRVNGSATLILIADVLPESGSPGAPVEAVARLQDLLLLQMGHEVPFDTKRLMGLLESARQDADRITVVNRLSSPDHPVLALVLRARPFHN
ncbi:hypothetical protein TOPH_04439 [Tolypocladium ophioglossoides CBS 100239]|uniref:Uncharacterized protein n=1 Tax=Tolypocladium ophioglossoides (strain CBS 100239) TaxID=1163406 RepID=A0A0L0NAK3_TOLOC|nr:hypothetical protein TOPH_04439 [Tolypocladium ophioglossoides CBS 100239]